MCPGSAMNRDLGDWMDVEDEREGAVWLKVSGLSKILIMEIEMDNRDKTDLDKGTDGIKDEISGVLRGSGAQQAIGLRMRKK